jgi:anti-sigma factor RsiW
MLTCREVAEIASEYLDDELPLLRRMRVRVHLMMCRRCPKHVDQLASTVNLLRRLPREAPPVHVENALVRSFREYFGH